MRRRLDIAGALLLALALVAVFKSYDNRRETARWYAEASDYNRAITRFLVDQRDRLADRPVAVYGVAGLSPWSLSAGGYLARLLGRDRPWHVFVMRPDIFYPLGALPHGSITVHLDERACEIASDPRTLHVVVAPDGHPQFAGSCRQALDLATPNPVVASWGPQQVTPAQRDAGFNMFFTGEGLVRGLGVRVGGVSTETAHARQGALMTTAVPPLKGAGEVITVEILRRQDVVLRGTVAVR
ncbi:MAG TPA: hypothetical protein VFX05_09360 [Casimicrobiaceae bacterium]|nr:hypothetical protein [Casimicrobiaceae bacterium]